MRRERQEGEQVDRSDSPTRTHYEIIDSVEHARRWVLPASWVRDHVRSRTTDPIPHIRSGGTSAFVGAARNWRVGLKSTWSIQVRLASEDVRRC